MDQKKPVIAAFDFDGTITRRDTLLPFLFHSFGATRFIGNLMRSVPALAGYAARMVANNIAKERMLTHFLKDMAVQELENLGRSFASEVIPRMVRKSAMDRMQWHQQQGHRCVIVSASLDVYLKPWAALHGIENVLCTSLSVTDGNTFTGKLATANCYGAEKRRRLEEWLGDRADYCIYAYGDSRGDRELLEMADYSFYRSMPTPDQGDWNNQCN